MKWFPVISLASLVWLVSGCFDDSFGGAPSGREVTPDEPLPVFVEIGDPAELKGIGAVDNIALEEGSSIYVYAFSENMLTSFRHTSTENEVNTLIDGSVDFPESRSGRRALTNSRGEVLQWPDEGLPWYYHSGELKQMPYEFYAYYIDDMYVSNDDVIREDDAVRLNVEIDGSQDLMSAKAEGSYCYNTALEGSNPKFYFRHHLVKLDFELLPGFASGGPHSVIVQSIEVESRYKGVFTVAEKSRPSQQGIEFPGTETRPLALKGTRGVPMKEYGITTLKAQNENPEVIPVDGSLLVAPQADSLIAYVTMKQLAADGSVAVKARTEVALKYSKGGKYGSFDAGNRYKVKFQIFGISTVRPVVTVEPWLSGGNASLDTEERPEI